jgi:lipoprotein-releasing system permease protein
MLHRKRTVEVGSHKEKDDEEEVIGHLHVVRGDLQGHEQGGEDASPQQFPTIGEHNACYGGRHVGKGDELPDVSGRYQDEEIGRECPHDTAQSGQPDRYAEENAMVQYKDRQAMAVIKGVEDNFEQLTSIDSLLYGTGKFLLSDSVVDYGFLGVELISELGTGIQFVDPLQVYAPKRNVRVNIANPTAAFNREYLFSPGAIFAVNQQKYDSRYILTSLDFARRLFNYDTEVSAIEMKLKPGSNIGSVQKKIAGILGDRFIVQNRYEQQADVFRIMEIEKLISYLFLTFILGIACFNVIGSLSMLILDKREDVETLRNLGADDRLIARIFLFEGRMISVFGALSGIVLGLLLCFLQQRFGLISLGGGNGSFVVDAYPVSVHATDIILVFLTVITVGFLSVWYPVRYLSKRLLRKR